MTDTLPTRPSVPVFRCETCRLSGCTPGGGCATMWCSCGCNTIPAGPMAQPVTVDAAFGPGRCYFCGTLLGDLADDIGTDEDDPHGAVVDDRTCLTCRRRQQRIRLRGDLP